VVPKPRREQRWTALLIGGLREILTSVFETSHLLEQQRQGTITRQLAAWAAILAVPTAIAGIYGMNFENMPELKMEYGYFIIVGIIAVLCAQPEHPRPLVPKHKARAIAASLILTARRLH